ncbi:MAG: hypothetical protein ACE5JE_04640 [Thermoplasmata archaeon]
MAEYLLRAYERSLRSTRTCTSPRVTGRVVRVLGPGRRAHLLLQIVGARAYFVLLILVLAAFGFAFRIPTPTAFLTAAVLFFLAALLVMMLLRGALRIFARYPARRSEPLAVKRVRPGTFVCDVRLGDGRTCRLKV